MFITIQVDPQSMAYVKFTPSAGNPHADFANEVYFPQVLEGIESDHDLIPIDNGVEGDDYDEPMERVIYPEMIKRSWIPAMHRRSLDPYDYATLDYQKPYENDLAFLAPQEDNTDIQSEQNLSENQFEEDPSEKLEDFEEYLPFIQYMTALKLTPDDIEYLLKPENADELRALLQEFYEIYEKAQKEKQREELIQEWIREENLNFLRRRLMDELIKPEGPATRFTRKYNTPDRFRSGWESRDNIPPLLDNTDASDLFESRVYFDENDPEFLHEESGSGENVPYHEVFREMQQNQNRYDYPNDGTEMNDAPLTDPNMPGFLRRMNINSESGGAESKARAFTEGGVVYVPDSQTVSEFKPDPEQLLKQNLGKFLDEYDWGFKRPERLDVKKPGPLFSEHVLPATESTDTHHDDLLQPEHQTDEFVNGVVKKEPRGAAGHPNPSDPLLVDTDYVYIGVKDG